MATRFRLTLAQQNPTVGAIAENAAAAREAWRRAASADADLVALPEMFLSGYQIHDLVRRPGLVAAVREALDRLAGECQGGPAMVVGAPLAEGGALYNAYYLLSAGAARPVARKHHLPHTDVFDEYRHFTPGPAPEPYRVGPIAIGTPICEDAWYADVAESLAAEGARLLLVPNGSPYSRGRQAVRAQRMRERVLETGLPLAYVNLVGGQDEHIFDGGSFVMHAAGDIVARAPEFEEALVHVDFDADGGAWIPRRAEGAARGAPAGACAGASAGASPVASGDAAADDTGDASSDDSGDWERDYQAMVLALRDYARKSGFSAVRLGLSGGVDSALVAAIAVDALGPERVRAAMLPSRYTSASSRADAEETARRLGLALTEIPIGGPVEAMSAALKPVFSGYAPDVTEENLQSRIRGALLMALANKFGELLLATGNKSELAVGYATIYGDMNGGYNPIKDLYKTRVFATCRWRNRTRREWMLGPEGEVIPERVIEKPPSAELAEDQRDEDSLPPYEELDAILEGLLDDDAPASAIARAGFDREVVARVERLVYASEWKRFQAPPGARLTRRAFGLDRRYPIVNRFRECG